MIEKYNIHDYTPFEIGFDSSFCLYNQISEVTWI